MFNAIIFDMDGVLVDSEPIYKYADSIFYKNLGWNAKEDDLASLTGCSGELIAQRLKKELPEIEYSIDELSQMYDKHIEHTLTTNEDLTLTDGVEKWIKTLKSRGLKIAVGSSSTYEMVHYVLRRFDIEKYFDFVVTSKDVKLTKPHPDIYNKCAEKLQIKPENCLVIEDSLNGLKAAKLAGMSCAAYMATNIYPMDTNEFDYVIKNFDDEEFNKIIALCQPIQ